ncbi:MAG: SH3 domain-containing protein [Burkholderiales bacterium]
MLYDAPSTKGTRVLILGAASPVEVLADIEGWVKVREHGGRLAWAETKALVARRTAVVSVPSALARVSASETAAPAFEARSGLIVEFVEQSGGWVKVRHRSGLTGYLRVGEVWGL